MTNKRRKFQKIKEEKPEQAENLHVLDLLIDELKTRYGVELEPKSQSSAGIRKLIEFLKKKFEFRFNEIAYECEFSLRDSDKFRMLKPRDYNCIYTDAKLNNHSCCKQFIMDLINSDKLSTLYNPYEDYFFNLKVWNQDEYPDYIAMFLEQVTLCDESEREVFIDYFKRWLTALVGSLLTDSVVNHECFVLVGKQGIYKTTFLNNLIPKNMRTDYLYSSRFMFDNKDHFKFLATKMLINLDELTAFSKTDERILKSVLTNDMIVIRLPYGATDTKMARRASFCGSTNTREFLKDETGNRRFLIFEVDKIVMNDSVSIDDVYAQALALYKNGLKFWFDEKDIYNIGLRNGKFHDVSIEQDLIEVNLIKPADEEVKAGNCSFKTPTEINIYLAGKSNKIFVNESTKRRINQVLRKFGFRELQKRLNGSSVQTRVWAVKFVETPEMADDEPEYDDYPI